MGEHVVATVDEIPVGGRKIVEVEGRSIGVFNVNGTFFALRNVCPHQGAPVCQGSIGGMTVCNQLRKGEPAQLSYVKKGEILRCPWHGWEFDIKTGKSIFDPRKVLVKQYEVTVKKAEPEPQHFQVETYPVKVEADWVIVHI